MGLKQHVIRRLVQQFGHPSGPVGRVVGWTMARRSSNVARTTWAVGLLDVQPRDRVLEIGCGPGLGLALAASKATDGRVVGVDRSDVMTAQARRRTRRFGSRVQVHNTPVERLPSFDEPFDKALAVNTVGHWDDAVAGLDAIRRVLAPDATIAVVSQPRCPGATAAHSDAAAESLVRHLTDAGYTGTRIERLELDPPAVCVLAHPPS